MLLIHWITSVQVLETHICYPQNQYRAHYILRYPQFCPPIAIGMLLLENRMILL
jgi:hypothetical protein